MKKYLILAIAIAIIPTIGLAHSGEKSQNYRVGSQSGTTSTGSMHTGTGHTEQDDERDHSGSHMGNSGVSIASGIKQLSAADRATLVATIRTYLVSKGIVLPVESTGSTQTGSTLSGTTNTGMSDIAALRPFIQKLSATDRATLVATIHTYLVSKGIVLRTEAIRDEMKQIKKDIHKAMKTMRKNMHDTLKQKQREMKEQLEDSK